MKIFVLSRNEIGAAHVADAFRRGFAQDPRPYGFQAAEGVGNLVEFSDGPHVRTPLQAWLMDAMGFDLLHALRNLDALRRADVTWTVLEWEWLAVSLLQRLGLAPKRPVVANSVWLLNQWSSWGRKRKWPYEWLMKNKNLYLTLHSKAALQESRRVLPDFHFSYIPFGISTLAFPLREAKRWSAAGRPVRVYSIGNDGTRDWETLANAFGNDSRFEVRIACKWLRKKINVEEYTNISSASADSTSHQVSLYEWADIVVVPMFENLFSGITVACEAVACGVPVVCSRTGGVPSYFEENEVLYVPPSDPDQLIEAVLKMTAFEWEEQGAAASRRFREDDYSADGMCRRYEALSRRLLKRGPD